MRIGYNFIGKFPLILGIFLALIGKKRYFLALGTIPVNGVGFIGRKITGLRLKKNNNDLELRCFVII